MDQLATVEDAVRFLVKEQRPVIVVDDFERENEGDLILPASMATKEIMAMVVRRTTGIVCVALPGARCDALDLPPMTSSNKDPKGTAFTVSCDAAGLRTGVSATERAQTIRILGSDTAKASDLVRPGHIFPLRARDGGVLERDGHTEAGLDLARLCGSACASTASLLAELVRESDGEMCRLADCLAVGREEGCPVISVAQLQAWRCERERVIIFQKGWVASQNSTGKEDDTRVVRALRFRPRADLPTRAVGIDEARASTSPAPSSYSSSAAAAASKDIAAAAAAASSSSSTTTTMEEKEAEDEGSALPVVWGVLGGQVGELEASLGKDAWVSVRSRISGDSGAKTGESHDEGEVTFGSPQHPGLTLTVRWNKVADEAVSDSCERGLRLEVVDNEDTTVLFLPVSPRAGVEVSSAVLSGAGTGAMIKVQHGSDDEGVARAAPLVGAMVKQVVELL